MRRWPIGKLAPVTSGAATPADGLKSCHSPKDGGLDLQTLSTIGTKIQTCLRRSEEVSLFQDLSHPPQLPGEFEKSTVNLSVMPWDVGAQTFGERADYKSQKQCQRTSFAFYQAVRDLLPVWLLEDMRTMEVFHWEDDGRACAFSSSEALLYALVHDHQQYAHYLLNRYSVTALSAPSSSFCCCQASATPHLSVAVRYNRVSILKMIVHTLKDFTTDSERRAYLDSRDACVHHADGGKTAVHLACDLMRPECLLLLLGHGACPYVTDRTGESPLDCLMQQMCQQQPPLSVDMRRKHVCLGYLMLFMPKIHFRFKEQLHLQQELWKSVLGEEVFNWLTGLTPPSLLVKAVQALARSVPEPLDSLPDFLKPLDFRLQ